MILNDEMTIRGRGSWWLLDAQRRVLRRGVFDNLVTRAGLLIYTERLSGAIGTPSPTGMQLGTSNSTAPSSTGAGAVLGSYLSGSSIGFVTDYPFVQLVGAAQEVNYRAEWPAGVATGTLREVTMINRSVATNSSAPAENVVARSLIGPVTKGAGEIFLVDWKHTFGTL